MLFFFLIYDSFLHTLYSFIRFTYSCFTFFHSIHLLICRIHSCIKFVYFSSHISATQLRVSFICFSFWHLVGFRLSDQITLLQKYSFTIRRYKQMGNKNPTSLYSHSPIKILIASMYIVINLFFTDQVNINKRIKYKAEQIAQLCLDILQLQKLIKISDCISCSSDDYGWSLNWWDVKIFDTIQSSFGCGTFLNILSFYQYFYIGKN